MAVTKIWRVRGNAGRVIDYASNPEKTVATLPEEELAEIADVLEYADDEVKTEHHHYTTGINCDKDSAKEEFSLTKRQFGKQGGIVAIHGYQSFEEEELTPDEADAIGVALAKELYLYRVKKSGGKAVKLASMGTFSQVAIKDKKIYYSYPGEETDENGMVLKTYKKVMKLNGKGKKDTETEAIEIDKYRSKKGYKYTFKTTRKNVMVYLKTPKGKIKLETL